MTILLLKCTTIFQIKINKEVNLLIRNLVFVLGIILRVFKVVIINVLKLNCFQCFIIDCNDVINIGHNGSI